LCLPAGQEKKRKITTKKQTNFPRKGGKRGAQMGQVETRNGPGGLEGEGGTSRKEIMWLSFEGAKLYAGSKERSPV